MTDVCAFIFFLPCLLTFFCSLYFLRVSCSQWHPLINSTVHSNLQTKVAADKKKMDAQDFSNFESILFVNTVFENNFRCFYNDEKNKQILFEDEDKSLTGSPLSEVKYELSPVSQSFELDLMPMTSSPILIRPQSTGSFSSSCDSEPQVRRKIGN